MQRFYDLFPSRSLFVNDPRLPRLAYFKTLLLATIPVMLAALTVLIVRNALTDGTGRNPTATTQESSPLSFRP